MNRSICDDELTIQINVLDTNRDDDFNELNVSVKHQIDNMFNVDRESTMLSLYNIKFNVDRESTMLSLYHMFNVDRESTMISLYNIKFNVDRKSTMLSLYHMCLK